MLLESSGCQEEEKLSIRNGAQRTGVWLSSRVHAQHAFGCLDSPAPKEKDLKKKKWVEVSCVAGITKLELNDRLHTTISPVLQHSRAAYNKDLCYLSWARSAKTMQQRGSGEARLLSSISCSRTKLVEQLGSW